MPTTTATAEPEAKETKSDAVPTGDTGTSEPKKKPDPVKAEEDTSILDSVAVPDKAAAKADPDPALAAVDPTTEQWNKLRSIGEQYGIPATQMLNYASEGYKIAQSAAQATKTAPAAKGADDPAGDDDFVPVSKNDLDEAMTRMEQRLQVSVAGVQNSAKLDSLLNGKPLTRDEAEAREIVQTKTYKLVAGGATLEQGFAQASREHAEYLARVKKRTMSDKVAAQRATGESGGGGGEAMPLVLPDYNHKASDFADGTALKEAMALTRQIHEGAVLPPR